MYFTNAQEILSQLPQHQGDRCLEAVTNHLHQDQKSWEKGVQSFSDYTGSRSVAAEAALLHRDDLMVQFENSLGPAVAGFRHLFVPFKWHGALPKEVTELVDEFRAEARESAGNIKFHLTYVADNEDLGS